MGAKVTVRTEQRCHLYRDIDVGTIFYCATKVRYYIKTNVDDPDGFSDKLAIDLIDGMYEIFDLDATVTVCSNCELLVDR
jgi:hypothetical protein